MDLTRGISLARPVDFSASGLRHFNAPPASSQPFSVPGFSGAVATGASCNCSTITLTPHCNGTHTECAGHLTSDPLDAHAVVPAGLLPAVLISVEPVEAARTDENTSPSPRPGDRLITAKSLERAWSTKGKLVPQALVIRCRESASQVPPYLSRQAAQLLVAREIAHLVVDIPSIDRTEDEGKLTAHRVFFGLPEGSTSLAQAARPRATVTELAQIPDHLQDGAYLLELQVPAIGGDAVPSRPLLYPLLSS